MTKNSYKFDYNQDFNSIIKVFGVGGGGSNAVNHMCRLGIRGVDFYVCNTDIQALQISPVENKIQIGIELTHGLGAGANPEVGKAAAEENKQQIKEVLQNNTKMVFVTAGMGGGTGTGAAPIIAQLAKDMGILTVGIVTMPFSFEGKPKLARAEAGIEELKKHCDTVLIILNNKLREVYGKASMKEAFTQADNVLANAAKSIAEIITVSGNINVDFEDVKTVMKNSGAAVMGTSIAQGENRAIKAAQGAINSPLLNDTNIKGAKYILISIVVGDEDDFDMDELEDITNYVQEQAGDEAEVIFGHAVDSSLGDAISVTIIATGFENREVPTKKFTDNSPKVYDLESSKQIVNKRISYDDEADFFNSSTNKVEPKTPIQKKPEKIVFELEGNYEIVDGDELEEKKKRILEEYYKKRQQSLDKIKSVHEMTNEELKNKAEVPAYMRKGVKLKNVNHSSDSNLSRTELDDDDELLGGNRFLHDNVD